MLRHKISIRLDDALYAALLDRAGNNGYISDHVRMALLLYLWDGLGAVAQRQEDSGRPCGRNRS